MLRAMRLDDAGAVAALIRTAFAAQPVVPEPPMSALRVSEADIAAHLRHGGGGAVMAVDGVLAGSALWAPKDGGLYISRVAVLPAFRRRGIARTLLAAAESAARDRGLPCLHLSTRLMLHDNRRLFAACGFTEGERSVHPGYASPTSVAMRKDIGAGPAFCTAGGGRR